MAKINAAVELFYSGAWNDITALDDVFTRDAIRITRGRPNASQKIPPSSLNLSLKNMSGRYSPRNPMSPLYKLIGRNTPIRVSVRYAKDTFTRTGSNGWGTPELGGPWTSADPVFSVIVGRGRATHATAGGGIRNTLSGTAGMADVTAVARMRIGQKLTGSGAMYPGILLRQVNAANFYQFGLYYQASAGVSGPVGVVIGKVVGGVNTNLFENFSWDVYDGSEEFWLKAECVGTTIRIKAWRASIAEPAAWTATVTDSAISAGSIGVSSSKDAGVTNVSPFVEWDDLDVRTIRFTGEVSTWPQTWTVDGKNVWVPIEAAGIMMRYNAPGTTAPVISSLRRDTLAPNASRLPYCYYPMEEGATAAGLADVVGNGTPMVASGTATSASAANFGSASKVPGSDWLPALEERQLDWRFASIGGSSTQWTVTFVGYNVGSLASSLSIFTENGYEIEFRFTNGVNDIFFWNPAGAQVATAQNIGTPYSNMFDGSPHCVQLSVAQNAGSLVFQWTIDSTSVRSGNFVGTLAKPYRGVISSKNAGTKATIGHLAVYDSDSPGAVVGDLATSMRAHPGERATVRLTRLCAQAGITLAQYTGPDTDPALVGVQRVATTLDLLQDAADADGGILYEPREFLGLAYRTHKTLYNQTPRLTLDYAAGGEVAPPLTPIEDWDAVANDVTVTRYEGSAARVVQETGPLNVKEPTADPDGVGRYPKDRTLVLFQDSQCLNQAAWMKHLGTWDEARYPVVNLDLTAMGAAGKTAQATRAASLDIGDRFAITHPPAWLPPDDIVQHAQGFTEVIESHRWSIGVNATPAGPYDVGVLNDSTRARLDNRDCTLNGSLDATSLTINVISVRRAWSTTAAPFDIKVGGERMTVTAATAGLTQTLTVTRSVNGIVKSHPSGTPVRVFRPLRLARR